MRVQFAMCFFPQLLQVNLIILYMFCSHYQFNFMINFDNFWFWLFFFDILSYLDILLGGLINFLFVDFYFLRRFIDLNCFYFMLYLVNHFLKFPSLLYRIIFFNDYLYLMKTVLVASDLPF